MYFRERARIRFEGGNEGVCPPHDPTIFTLTTHILEVGRYENFPSTPYEKLRVVPAVKELDCTHNTDYILLRFLQILS